MLLMLFGDFPRFGTLLAVVVLALVGCSSSVPPSATLIDPSAPTAPSTLVFASITPPPETTTTAVPPTITLPPTTLPAAINGLVPSNDTERDVLVATDHLFGLLKQNLYVRFEGDAQLEPIYVEPLLSRNRKFLQGRRDRNEVDRRGDFQLQRFRSLRELAADRWAVVVCSEDNGALIRTKGTPDTSDDEIVNTGLGGSVIEFQLVETPAGWRFADGKVIDDFEGSKCAE